LAVSSAPSPGLLRALGALLALAGAARAQGLDPFVASRRWSRAPLAPAAWIPRSVVCVGQELVWSGAGGAEPELMLCAGASADPRGTLLASDTGGMDGLVGAPLVAAGDAPDELFALVQLAPAGSALRTTLVRGYDARGAGQRLVPRWEHELGPRGNGPALLVANESGSALCAAVYDAGTRRLALEWLAPASGEPELRREFAADGLRALALARDGARLAVAAGSTVRWLARDGGELAVHALGASTAALALSADGAWLAHGVLGGVELWHDTGAGVELAGRFPGGATELLAAAALSADGETLALAWWDARDGASVRLERIETQSGVRSVLHEQRARAGAPQNFPSALVLSADGRRVALGLWGQGDERPEALLLERGRAEPLLALDLAGSVDALSLDDGGTCLCVARRARHATEFTRAGALERFETGERELVLRAAPRPGGELELALRVPADAGGVRFALGLLRSTPRALSAGELWLRAPWSVFGGVRSAAQRVDAALRLPADPAWIGLPLCVQAAWSSAGRARLSAALRFELF